MALTTARPWKDKRTGKLHLRQRTPSDLTRLKGTFVSLPLGEQTRTIKIGEMVQMSLHTRDISEAKRLHAIADAALKQFWEAHRTAQTIGGNSGRVLGLCVRPEAIRPAVTFEPLSGVEFLTAEALLEKWLAYHTDKKAKNTLKRYKASLKSLAAFTGKRDVRSPTGDDLHAWAEHRRDSEGVSPRAVNKNDLVAASSMFKWAMDRNGGRVMVSNPAKGVHLDEPRAIAERDRTFRSAEARAILKAASSVEIDPKNLYITGAKRWCPWLAAYSGARIAELTRLAVEDIRTESGVHVMDPRETKTGVPRTVPLHEHLIEQGFLTFVARVGSGPLFYDRAKHRSGAQITPAEVRAQQLAAWVREAADLKDPNVDPNHGWRHTWKTIALGAGIEERIRDAVTGHRVMPVGRRYETPPIPMLADALAKFPRYEIE
jgi:integrase